MNQWIVYFVMASIFSASSSWSYEVDNFTYSDRKLPDSRDALNAEVDRRIDIAIEKTNSSMKSLVGEDMRCDDPKQTKAARVALFKNMNDRLSSGLAKRRGIEKYAESGLSSENRLKVKVEKSIYRNSDSAIIKNFELSSVIQIDDIHFGTDKLDHFFTDGFSYYDARKQGLSATLKNTGSRMEKTFSGKQTTGVYSFGDLAANYDGFRFWNRVLGEGISPCPPAGDRVGEIGEGLALTRNSNAPYQDVGKEILLCCQDGKFARNPNAKFDFSEYVSAAWDESINCSRYKKELEGIVVENMKNVSMYKGASRPVNCPRAPEACKGLIERYGMIGTATHILHDACICADDPQSKACESVLPSSQPSTPASTK